MNGHMPIKTDETRGAMAEHIYELYWPKIVATYVNALERGVETPVVLVCDLRSAGGRDVLGAVFGDDLRNRAEAAAAGADGGTTTCLMVHIEAAPAELVIACAEEPALVKQLADTMPGFAAAAVYCDWFPVTFQSRYSWDYD